VTRAGRVAVALIVLASATPPRGAVAGDPRCERPATYTGFAERERYRGLLEEFRETLEAGRDAAEAERGAGLIDVPSYRQRLAEYRRAIAVYREGLARYRASDCRYVGNQILAIRVEDARADEVVVRVTYYYTGDRGEGTAMQAITRLDGESTGHWAYQPARVGLGLNDAGIRLGMNRDAPDRYESDELLVSFFRPGAEAFDERVVPFAKTWRRTAP
jgi:hypothetical protein